MSRSYKHTPIAKQKNDKDMKTKAARVVRHHKDELANGNAYKRLFCSWNICDWSFRESFINFYQQAIDILRRRFPKKSEHELDKIVRNKYRRSYRQK